MTEKQMKKQEEIFKQLLPLKDKFDTIFHMSYLLNVSYVEIPYYCKMRFIPKFIGTDYDIPYNTFGYANNNRIIIYNPQKLITVKDLKTGEILYPTKAEAKKFISFFNEFYEYVQNYVESFNNQFKN